MRRKPTALIAFIVAVLVSVPMATTGTDGTDGGGSRDRTVRVVADDRGPTAVTSLPRT
ncbi:MULTISPECIES: hypothetical protein [unclassified Streptomyces]|uniref:hypothetical protein n=1 Tax=unclassified Streptomyces TaxID=2593676 RepID=UPI000B2EF956|nr:MULTISPECIES: hypothetical protein [unclassified Streptomyces]